MPSPTSPRTRWRPCARRNRRTTKAKSDEPQPASCMRAGSGGLRQPPRPDPPPPQRGGIAHFIDHQISVPPEEALLEARILNVRPPYANFYRAAIGALDKAAAAQADQRFAWLPTPAQREFVGLMRQGKLQGWQGPAQGFVYFVLRSDAVDVVYGTVEGYEALGIPYQPHIAPLKRW